MWNTASLLIPSVGWPAGWTPPHSTGIIRAVSWQGLPQYLPVPIAQAGMDRFWQTQPQWLVLWITILAILIAIAWYVVGKIRPKTIQKERPASEWLTKYRELHSQGGLSDEEFRTIKTKLAEQLQDELNDNGKKG
jgi:uncharacterized membrane protein